MRLIDADAKELKQRININFGAVTRFTIKSILKDAPTIDAVPVVRCKDCKRSAWRQSPFGIRTFACELLCADIKPDDFCSYGERKDGGG